MVKLKQSELHPLMIKANQIRVNIFKLPIIDNSTDLSELLVTTKQLVIELRQEIDKELKILSKVKH